MHKVPDGDRRLAAPACQLASSQPHTETLVDGLALAPFKRLQVWSLLQAVRNATVLAEELEATVLAEVNPTAAYRALQQVPGVGPILGMTILLESSDFQRFPSAGHYASYCRNVKSERSSNGKLKGRNNARNGNAYLAWAFMEAATIATYHYPRIRAWHTRKKQRRNGLVATKALACKLAKAVWHVMQGEPYDEVMLFG